MFVKISLFALYNIFKNKKLVLHKIKNLIENNVHKILWIYIIVNILKKCLEI